LLRVLGVVAGISACLLAASANTASADPSLDATKDHYEQVTRQVRKLDHRAEQLTEEYNKTVWELQQLHRQIRYAQHRLHDAEVQLAAHKKSLALLVVASYKGLTPETSDILLGAGSLEDVTGGLDLKARLDRAMATATAQIEQLRQEILEQKAALEAAQTRAEQEREQLAVKRREIRHQLRRRRLLMELLGNQIAAGEAADTIGQAKLALRAAKWIVADSRANKGDAGAVLRDQIALEALRQIGVPYKWGGASPETGFDCSGLIMWLWAQHGYSLPHFAAAQYALGPQVPSQDDLKIGDLVFFHKLGHVGMYIGNGYVIHAPHTGDVVRIAPFALDWFQATYVGATRPGPV
jgi:cell wall-associated NlpC family hydrolase